MMTSLLTLTIEQWAFSAVYLYAACGLCFWLYCYLGAPDNRCDNVTDRALIILVSLIAWPKFMHQGINAEVSDEENYDEPPFV